MYHVLEFKDYPTDEELNRVVQRLMGGEPIAIVVSDSYNAADLWRRIEELLDEYDFIAQESPIIRPN